MPLDPLRHLLVTCLPGGYQTNRTAMTLGHLDGKT
jgi:hypothetical protein